MAWCGEDVETIYAYIFIGLFFAGYAFYIYKLTRGK